MADEIEQTGNDIATEIKKTAPAGPLLGGLGTAIGGPAIGAAGTLVGGLISNLFNKGQAKRGEDFQKEFAQNAISWRVADARRAGIHPLAALGANTASGQPMVLGDALGEALSQGSQNIGNAVARMQSYDERMAMMQAYRIGEAQIAKTEAEAQYYQKLASDVNNAGNQGGLGIMSWEQYKSGGQGLEGQVPNVPGYSNMVEVKPGEVTSGMTGRPGFAAGNDKGYQEIELPNGLPLSMPIMKGESWQEHLSEMSKTRFMGLLIENQQIYGKQWLADFAEWYMAGQTPKGRYTPLSSADYKRPAATLELSGHVDDWIREKLFGATRKGRR